VLKFAQEKLINIYLTGIALIKGIAVGYFLLPAVIIVKEY